MTIAVAVDMFFEVFLKLRAAIGLKEVNVPVKSSRHALGQKVIAISGSEFGSKKHVDFSTVNIDPREGKETAKVHRIHLDDLPGPGGLWDGSTFLVLLPCASQDILLMKNFVDLGGSQRDLVFFFEVVLDFLSITIVFSFPNGPNPALQDGIHLPVDPGNLLCLLVPIKEPEEPVLFDSLDPEYDCLPVFAQFLSNMNLGNSLLMEFPGKGNER